jgi:hypothetical protein
MADTTIIRDLTLSYRAHSLATNYGQGIRNFMKLHGIPGATSVINLVKAVNFDRLVMVIDGASFVIERDYRY